MPVPSRSVHSQVTPRTVNRGTIIKIYYKNFKNKIELSTIRNRGTTKPQYSILSRKPVVLDKFACPYQNQVQRQFQVPVLNQNSLTLLMCLTTYLNLRKYIITAIYIGDVLFVLLQFKRRCSQSSSNQSTNISSV